jgi:hypothetical protein
VRRIRFSAALIGALLVALAGCGGGGGGSDTGTSPPGRTLTATLGTNTDGKTVTGQSRPKAKPPSPTTTEPEHKQKGKGKTSPEDQPGGAGDETPIATQALFTGTGGTISPARVRVPPFIAVQVVLRCKDAKGYTLIVHGHELAVGEGRNRATVKLDGLKPGGRYVLKNVFGTPKQLVIVANAEPGP